MFKRKYIWIIIYSIVLLSFTAYVMLDTFVITRVYSQADQLESAFSEKLEGQTLQSAGTETEGSSETSAAEAESESETVITKNSYYDGNISIVISEYQEEDTTIYVADVQVTSPEYLKTALAQGLYGKNVKAATSDIAEENDAILAVNGDYYGAQEKGYVIRNGVLYRDTSAGREDLVIYSDGSFGIINESEISAQQLLESGAWQVLSFGPALVENGELAVSVDDEVGRAKSSNPRTAIAVIDELHYLFIVSDGRTDESEGLSLFELAEFIKGLGAETAYNLDGGGSSTMYFNGEVVNNPTTNGRKISERSVSDIVYIG